MRCEVIKYVQSNPEVSSIKSFVGIQLKRNWLNDCHVRFSSNVGLSYNVQLRSGMLWSPKAMATGGFAAIQSCPGIWLENPKTPYLPTLMAKLCLSFAMSLQKQQCI